MRRIMMVLTVAVLMAAMMVATAPLPAFAQGPTGHTFKACEKARAPLGTFVVLESEPPQCALIPPRP